MKQIIESMLALLSLGLTRSPRAHAEQETSRAPWPCRVLAVCLVLAVCQALGQDIRVIANRSVKPDVISAAELKRIFLQDTNSLRDGTHVEPVLQKNNAIDEAFCQQYLRRRASEARSYYLALAFTGKGSVPKQFNSDPEVAEYVAKTQGAIGYVSRSARADGVKTLFIKPEFAGRERALLTRVEPEYPQVLQKLKIGGTVRLRLVISPQGSVESAALLGGNPILGEAAVAAARRWVYTPAGSQSTMEVTIPFRPNP